MVGIVAYIFIINFFYRIYRPNSCCYLINFIKKFYEYTNGCLPNLEQRNDLYALIPDDADQCGIQELITSTLSYTLKN